MRALTEGAHSVGGLVDSVITEAFLSNSDPTLFRNQIVVNSLAERKQGLFDCGDAIVALPGGLGTLDELIEVCSQRQLSLHRKPIVVLNTDDYFSGIRQFIENAIRLKFVAPGVGSAIQFVNSPELVIHSLRTYAPVSIDKRAIHSSELNASDDLD